MKLIKGKEYRLNNPMSDKHNKIVMVVELLESTLKLYWPHSEEVTHHVYAVESLLEPTSEVSDE